MRGGVAAAGYSRQMKKDILSEIELTARPTGMGRAYIIFDDMAC